MVNIINYIPGFRSNKGWKKIIAIIYYVLVALMFLFDWTVGLFMLSGPFMILNFIDLFRIKRKGIPAYKVVVPLLFSFVLAITAVSVGVSRESSSPEQEVGLESQESLVVQDEDSKEENLKEEKEALDQEIEPEDGITQEEERKAEDEESYAVNEEEQEKIEEEKKLEEEEQNKQEEETKPKAEGQLKAHFLDVGQGDSALILAGSNAMLIDAGDRGYGSGIVNYLKKQGVKKLDYLVLTHPHADHIGGAVEVINAFEIEKIIMPKVEHTTRTFENLLETIKSKGMKITAPIPGDEYELGSAKFKILAPNSSSYKSLNDYSVVIRLTFGNTAFLFTGDAESTSESQILSKGFEIKSDVLKVGHHGSSTSTSDRFLKSVSPKYAVISVGKGNSYGHPTQEVLGRLDSYSVKVYRTDEVGTIVAVSDGTNITFDKEASSIAKSASSSQSDKAEEKNKEATTPQSETDNNEEIVYITKTGSKYHRGDCRYLKSSKIPISLEEAKADGYEPCKVCNPKK